MKDKRDRGIVVIAYGKEFDKLAAHTVKFSRQFTDLPICVMTNLKNHHPRWSEIADLEFRYIPMKDSDNRAVKTMLSLHTPYEQTLFMDADAVIQKPGIEQLFSFLDDSDLVCQYFGKIFNAEDPNYEQEFVAKTYDKLAKLLGETYPIELFAEAALLFKKYGKETWEFFWKWNEYWKLMGSGRDMPAFCFAVKHLRYRVKVFGEDGVNFCKNAEDENAFIQHKGFAGFEKKFGLPEYVDWNPKL